MGELRITLDNLAYLTELFDLGEIQEEVLNSQLILFAKKTVAEYLLNEDSDWEDTEEESPLRTHFKKFYPEN